VKPVDPAAMPTAVTVMMKRVVRRSGSTPGVRGVGDKSSVFRKYREKKQISRIVRTASMKEMRKSRREVSDLTRESNEARVH
jgi:hypothetical protein